MTNSSDIIETCKANAARDVVRDNIVGDCIMGIGSGSTMCYVLKNVVELCETKGYKVKCIPTSFQSKQLIYEYKLPITEIECNPIIDVTIDGADEVDENFVAIKGGGACLAQEKIVASSAKKFFVVADYRKNSKHLGQNWSKGIPIEVLPMAFQSVRYQISRLFGCPLDEIAVRIGEQKAGPVVTDNGNFILDWNFDFKSHDHDWKSIADQIKLIPGVLEIGIFADMIHGAYFGLPDGSVLKRIPPPTK